MTKVLFYLGKFLFASLLFIGTLLAQLFDNVSNPVKLLLYLMFFAFE